MEEKPVPQPQVLDLDDLAADAPVLKLGGATYPVMMPNRLGLSKTAEAQKLGTQFVKFGTIIQGKEDDPDAIDAAIEEMEPAFEKFLDIILPTMPKEIREDLDEDQKMAIFAFFSEVGAASREYQKAILARSSRESPSTTESDGQSS